MKRKFLEDLGLDKDVIDKILDENSADIGKAKGDVTVLENKVQTLEKELEKAQGEVKTRDGQLEELKKVDAAGLQAQIEKLQGENKTLAETNAKEMKTLKVQHAVEAALTAARIKNMKAGLALLDIDPEKAEFDDVGALKGLAEKIEGLQKAEDSKFLFDASKPKLKGAEPGEPGKEDPDGKVDTSKMTYTELAAYMAANPDAKID